MAFALIHGRPTFIYGDSGGGGGGGGSSPVFTIGSGSPSSPGVTSGDTYLNETNGNLYKWNGSTWGSPVVQLAVGVAGTTFTIGSGAPGSGGTASGDQYLDEITGNIYTWNGSTWGSPVVQVLIEGTVGPVYNFVRPVDSDFTWINQSGASINSSSYPAVVMSCAPSDFTHNLNLRTKPIIGATFTTTAFMTFTGVPTNWWLAGIGCRNAGTGALFLMGFGWYGGQSIFHVAAYNSPTSFDTFVVDDGFTWTGLFLQISSDGTNVNFSYSQDGFEFVQVFTQAIGTFLGGLTDVCWGGDFYNDLPGNCSLWHWHEA